MRSSQEKISMESHKIKSTLGVKFFKISWSKLKLIQQKDKFI